MDREVGGKQRWPISIAIMPNVDGEQSGPGPELRMTETMPAPGEAGRSRHRHLAEATAVDPMSEKERNCDSANRPAVQGDGQPSPCDLTMSRRKLSSQHEPRAS